MKRSERDITNGQDPKAGGTTRERILLLLKTSGRMSANELSIKLELTEMAIRRHMYELEREGSVHIMSIRQSMGRPLHMFELTAAADDLFPKNYHTLTIDLLAELEEDPEYAPLIDRMFEGRKRKLHERYSPRMKGKSLEQRVHELAVIQNAGGYMAQVERQNDNEYMLYEYNCPITGVAGKYGQACNCELALFRSLLEVTVERTECLAKGDSRCSYSIGSKS
ncbi:metalloregulator ArsR/SmtB family transcription factor [Paenibacillus sp. L3-i20]|uniref:helix-turn-helix transcriptional regulator n=1 Tax=Paenibacillus sp. L3-i20 TaxID=2905833 RepID=UPI001EE06EBF|nr:metalloregulator ArsR/SmtB family transcription factor [Paenibacillus sp. L3-i20]GKU79922.1 transcriptional regulator [Paenibacillus sp. L3-i20]